MTLSFFCFFLKLNVDYPHKPIALSPGGISFLCGFGLMTFCLFSVASDNGVLFTVSVILVVWICCGIDV